MGYMTGAAVGYLYILPYMMTYCDSGEHTERGNQGSAIGCKCVGRGKAHTCDLTCCETGVEYGWFLELPPHTRHWYLARAGIHL